MKTIMEIMKMIDLQEEVINLVLGEINHLNFKKFETDILDLLDINKAIEAKEKLKEALDPDDNNMKMLACMLYALTFTYERYLEKGISDEIFIDTMKAFRRFLDEHYAGNQTWKFDRAWWTHRQIAMTIFRIGELEYEMKDDDNGKYISIHIPSDANLSSEKVNESFNSAFKFFEEFYPEYSDVNYRCRSWLLSSDLLNLLPEDANIIKFRSLFEIIDESYGQTGFIKWIYKTEYENYEELPEDTTLQRNLKQYLLNGGSISTALGFLKKDLIFLKKL